MAAVGEVFGVGVVGVCFALEGYGEIGSVPMARLEKPEEIFNTVQDVERQP